MFDLMVLYEWKPGITAERIEHHLRLIRALVGQVPGLIALRVGPRTFGFGPTSEGWTHAAIMTFRQQADYLTFGKAPAHDRIAPELVADLQRITAIGFESPEHE
jgi:hypothetical protein